MRTLLVSLLFITINTFASESKEIDFYNSNQFMMQQYTKQISRWANMRIQKIKQMNLIDARKMSKKNLHLLKWPDEKKMIYRIGEDILKDYK